MPTDVMDMRDLITMVDRNISVLKKRKKRKKKRVGYVAAAVSDSISHANFILQIHDVIILCVFLLSTFLYYTYL